MVEEIKNPETNLLKAIVISLTAITGFYLLINFMYISILGVENILASPAVATSYAQEIFPQLRYSYSNKSTISDPSVLSSL